MKTFHGWDTNAALFNNALQEVRSLHKWRSLEETLPLEILVNLLVDHVALRVLELLLLLRLPRFVRLLRLELLPERHGVFDLGEEDQNQKLCSRCI